MDLFPTCRTSVWDETQDTGSFKSSTVPRPSKPLPLSSSIVPPPSSHLPFPSLVSISFNRLLFQVALNITSSDPSWEDSTSSKGSARRPSLRTRAKVNRPHPRTRTLTANEYQPTKMLTSKTPSSKWPQVPALSSPLSMPGDPPKPLRLFRHTLLPGGPRRSLLPRGPRRTLLLRGLRLLTEVHPICPRLHPIPPRPHPISLTHQSLPHTLGTGTRHWGHETISGDKRDMRI